MCAVNKYPAGIKKSKKKNPKKYYLMSMNIISKEYILLLEFIKNNFLQDF